MDADLLTRETEIELALPVRFSAAISNEGMMSLNQAFAPGMGGSWPRRKARWSTDGA